VQVQNDIEIAATDTWRWRKKVICEAPCSWRAWNWERVVRPGLIEPNHIFPNPFHSSQSICIIRKRPRDPWFLLELLFVVTKFVLILYVPSMMDPFSLWVLPDIPSRQISRPWSVIYSFICSLFLLIFDREFVRMHLTCVDNLSYVLLYSSGMDKTLI
jgi:hypothetical protein